MARSRRDVGLLFTTRIVRLFAYGSLSVVLALYLAEVGLDDGAHRPALHADAGGRCRDHAGSPRRPIGSAGGARLMLGGALMALAGTVFLMTRQPALLLVAAIIGVISPSGNEIGPFLSVEQAGLTQLLPDKRRTHVFAWYNLAGSFATATGALCGGLLAQALQSGGLTPLNAFGRSCWVMPWAGLLLILGSSSCRRLSSFLHG